MAHLISIWETYFEFVDLKTVDIDLYVEVEQAAKENHTSMAEEMEKAYDRYQQAFYDRYNREKEENLAKIKELEENIADLENSPDKKDELEQARKDLQEANLKVEELHKVEKGEYNGTSFEEDFQKIGRMNHLRSTFEANNTMQDVTICNRRLNQMRVLYEDFHTRSPWDRFWAHVLPTSWTDAGKSLANLQNGKNFLAKNGFPERFLTDAFLEDATVKIAEEDIIPPMPDPEEQVNRDEEPANDRENMIIDEVENKDNPEEEMILSENQAPVNEKKDDMVLSDGN